MEPATMRKARKFSEVGGVVVATSFATPKMQNAFSDWCDSGSIIRPGSSAFNMGSCVTILALAGVGYRAPLPRSRCCSSIFLYQSASADELRSDRGVQ